MKNCDESSSLLDSTYGGNGGGDLIICNRSDLSCRGRDLKTGCTGNLG